MDGARTKIRIAAILIPFAGVTFLWFIGVVRDGFGRFEDKFFASVFIGSGLLFLAMAFVASAVGVALSTSHGFGTDPGAHADVVAFGQVLMTTLTKTYALRMAAVFMFLLATIWLKTSLMPRWLVFTTYGLAVALMISADISMWLALSRVGDGGQPAGVESGRRHRPRSAPGRPRQAVANDVTSHQA